MPKIKLAYILSQFPAFTETFIIREISQLKQKGIEVEVFSLKNPDKNETFRQENLTLYKNTHYYPFLFSFGIWEAVIHYLRTKPESILSILYNIIRSNIKDPVVLLKSLAVFPKALRIARALSTMGITKIHSHWATIPATVSWIVSELNGSSFSFTAHAWDIFKADNMLAQKIEAASKMITISDFNKQYLLANYPGINPNKIEVIHIGLDFDRFKPVTNNKNGTFTILSVGRMVKTKGFQYLLRACDLLRNKNIQFKCQIIYVSDIYEKEIFKLRQELNLGDIVELIPGVTQEKILDYYSSADCFVLPCIVGEDGDRDGIPTVIIEAMAMNLPVVSTTVSGIPEIIKDRETGLLVRPEDVNGLCLSIEMLYKDSELCSRLGAAGRNIVLEEFDISSNVERLIESVL